MLLFAAISYQALSVDLTLNCDFVLIASSYYICKVSHVIALDSTLNITFAGTHLAGLTNEDVWEVQILDSNTPFMIPSMFETFRNMKSLEFRNSGLEKIDIPDFVQLEYLILRYTNLQRIENGVFRNQKQLKVMTLTGSTMLKLYEDAFEGLESLGHLTIAFNNIQQILPRTLNPLVNIMYLDLEGNALTRIDEGIFSRLRMLRSLYLERNQINKIHPGFSNSLPGGLLYVYLTGNECVNAVFDLENDLNRIGMNYTLRTCFDNFIGDA